MPATPPRIAAFHAQQAAEKAFKALLIALQILVPRTHHLRHLVALPPPDLHAARTHADLDRITRFAVNVRYPDDLDDVSPDDAEAAVADAARIVAAVEADLVSLLAPGGGPLTRPRGG